MAWVQRLGNIVKSLAVVSLEMLALFTEALKVAATHLDAVIDDLQEQITTGDKP